MRTAIKAFAILAFFALAFVASYSVFSGYFAGQRQSTSQTGSTGGTQFVGSRNSDVYHYPGCSYAQRIKPENRIWFSDSADARAHGYRPCKVCNPP